MKLEILPNSIEVKQLIEKDSRFEQIVQNVGPITIHLDKNYVHALISAIIAQQLSGKVAQVIERRVYDYFKQDITTKKILDEDEQNLRNLGLSFPKIKYLKSLALCIDSRLVTFERIDEKSDQEIIDMLVQVKGIGVWTAQMFLIFAMGKMDVFSSLDLGLRNGVKKLYRNENLTKDEIEVISQQWTPHRTIASLYIWRFID